MFTISNIALHAGQATLKPFDDSFGIAFWMGGFPMRWYAIFFMLGFLVAIITGCLIAHYRYHIKYDIIFWAGIIALPSAFIGARLWSAMIGDLKWENFFNFNSGGLAIQGGVILCSITLLIYLFILLRNPKFHVRLEIDKQVFVRRPSVWIIVDICLPLVLLGQAIGRWGNFFNGEIFGSEVSSNSLEWLRLIMPGVFDNMRAVVGNGVTSNLVNGAYYQPLFLYEFSMNIVSFIFICFILPNIKHVKAGVAGSSYLVLYGITRFIMEPLRFAAYEFTATYVINGLLMATGVGLIIFAQFICPRYRDHQVIYRFWIIHIRSNLIQLGLKLNIEKAQKYNVTQKQKDHYGFEKMPNFNRAGSNYYYYGGR